jgi:hypothetical protein
MGDSMYKIYSPLVLKENGVSFKESDDVVSFSVAFKDISLADV